MKIFALLRGWLAGIPDSSALCVECGKSGRFLRKEDAFGVCTHCPSRVARWDSGDQTLSPKAKEAHEARIEWQAMR